MFIVSFYTLGKILAQKQIRIWYVFEKHDLVYKIIQLRKR